MSIVLHRAVAPHVLSGETKMRARRDLRCSLASEAVLRLVTTRTQRAAPPHAPQAPGKMKTVVARPALLAQRLQHLTLTSAPSAQWGRLLRKGLQSASSVLLDRLMPIGPPLLPAQHVLPTRLRRRPVFGCVRPVPVAAYRREAPSSARVLPRCLPMVTANAPPVQTGTDMTRQAMRPCRALCAQSGRIWTAAWDPFYQLLHAPSASTSRQVGLPRSPPRMRAHIWACRAATLTEASTVTTTVTGEMARVALLPCLLDRRSGGKSTLAARSISNTLTSGTVQTFFRPHCSPQRSLSA